MSNPQNTISSLKKRMFKRLFHPSLTIIAIFIAVFVFSAVAFIINSTIGIILAIALLCIACVLAFSISISRAKKITNEISSIADTISEVNSTQDATSLVGYINGCISDVLAQNRTYTNTINEKDSLLKGIFLQSRMRDIYVSLDDVEAQLDNAKPFVMVYFRVHYKEAFFQTIREEPGKSTFFLKQLIELYFSGDGLETSTFQVENDQFVSIINTEGDESTIVDSVNSAVKKLENESDYVFFTVVISKLHTDHATLKAHFDLLSRLSRYAKPVMENQILLEEQVNQGAGQFYFTVEQMEKLSSFMQNGSIDDTLRNLNEILDYNIKKLVSGFDLYLLCTEIVNCAVKLLNRLFHATPASLNLSRVYAQLDRAVTVEQYQQICADLLTQTIEYITYNKREEDYIINFILDYVEKHYAEDIYLNLFADKLSLTSAYISSYFKEKMNVNLTDYLNSYRIKKAITLIANPQNKNKDVAEAVGLQNINTFIRLFKKYTGYTPGEYRKKHFSDFSDL